MLKWIIERVDGQGSAKETELGNVPQALDMRGMESFGEDKLAAAMRVTAEEWRKEMPLQRAFA